jgi:gamma-tubulin complex component 5
LNHLRHLGQHITPSLPLLDKQCRTFEAFSTAVERQLHAFDLWCSIVENHISLAQQGKYSSDHVISLLSLEQKVSDKMAGTFVILLDVVRIIEGGNSRTTPSAMSCLILNTLLGAIRARLAANDTTTVKDLSDVWRESAEPLWSNLEKWLRDGIPIRAGFVDDHHKAAPTWDEKEFFIRINPLMELGDPDFWDGGYTLPPRHIITGTSSDIYPIDDGNIPVFLVHVARAILAAGKAVGLLRAIDMIHLVGDDWLRVWIRFKDLTKSLPLQGLDKGLQDLISDTLLPPCRLVQSSLRHLLVEVCDLWKHLRGLENVCLMTRGDAMSHFGEKLFARVGIVP